jgi:alpha-maltose-1-phosphate synthase
MKALVLYPYPAEPDGQSLQGEYLVKGLKELGHDAMPCDREDNLAKTWAYSYFKPDVVIGVGYWGDAPELIDDPIKHGLTPVPWFNADGWVANYHKSLNKLPLITATSNWVKDTYKRDGVKDEIVQVAHIGFDDSKVFPMEDDDPRRVELRRLLGIKPDEKMILTVGGDVTSKGAQEMMRALAKVDKSFKKWKYVCKVWESYSADNHGKEEDDLIDELEIDREKIIYLCGKYPPEFLGILLNACDVYAAPSRLEGFGMIQMEAQACGKPVVSINVGGPKDTIVNNKTGFLVDIAQEIKLDREWAYPWMGFEEKKMIKFDKPKTFGYRADIDQLAECTLKLLTDDKLRNKMGKAAEKHAMKNFHYKVTAKRMADLIEKYVLKKSD